jgi:flavin reductase (DIM6/NTAB) family NADH-FMN oxidoreductase RutF
MNFDFKVIDPREIKDNTFKLIGKDWMLITAGDINKFNTMTASWGGLGVLWNKKVSICVIRPSRYTYQFMEQNDIFTLSFFDDKYRDVLNFCGSKSGRDVDKINTTGITPVKGINDGVYFAEAKLVLECKKLYFQDLNPANFIDTGIEKNYDHEDYHRMYIGEILVCHSKM